jgi:hypothetical protein
MSRVWSAASGGLRLGASVTGDVLTVELHNAGDVPLRVLSAVSGDLDWYAAHLDGADTLYFVTDRDESAVEIADLAPGGSVTHDVDLPAWTGAGPGRHTLECTYEVDADTAAAFGGGVWTGALRTPALVWMRDRTSP